MRKFAIMACLATVTALYAGCVGEREVVYAGPTDYVVVDGAVYDPSPYDSNVYVVRGAPYGVYFSEGFYWRNYNGGWHRSAGHGAGWVRYDRVPTRVVEVHGRYRR